MLGCLAIGLLHPVIRDPQTRLFLLVGLLGGFTTFSGLGLEVYRYIEAGSTKLAAIYGLLSLFLGTVLVYFGMKLQAILN
jgi:CrcB protein